MLRTVAYSARDILKMPTCIPMTAIEIMAHRWYLDSEMDVEFLHAPRFARVPALAIPVPDPTASWELWVTCWNFLGWFNHLRASHSARSYPVTVGDPTWPGVRVTSQDALGPGQSRTWQSFVMHIPAGTDVIEIGKQEEMSTGLIGVEFRRATQEASIDRPQSQMPQPVVFGLIDMGGLAVESIHGNDATVITEFCEQMHEMGYTDFGYQVYGGSAGWSKAAEPVRSPPPGHQSHGNWTHPNNMWYNGPEKVQQDIDCARAAGLRVTASFRINNEWLADWARAIPLEPHSDGVPDFASKFSVAHPEYWRTFKDGSGSYGAGLDFAHPEVREQRLAIIREWCDLFSGFDGICIDLHRHPPVVSYAGHAVQSFWEMTGINVRQVEPADEQTILPAWLKFRAEYFTEFMRNVRREITARYGSSMQLSARVSNTFDQALLDGSDLEVWIDEKLVDTLILQHRGTNNPPDTDIRPIIKAAHAKGIRVIPLFGGHDAVAFESDDLSPLHPRLARWQKWGADGFGFYEGGRIARDGRWLKELPSVIRNWR